MSATNAPFGLRPSFHPSGLDRAIALANGIASGYSTGILKGQPVALNTSGNIIAATAGSAYQGAFAGHEWTDVSGRRQISNQWVASTAYTTGSEVTYYYSDPAIVYDIQADGSLAQTLSVIKQTSPTSLLARPPRVCRNAPSRPRWLVRVQLAICGLSTLLPALIMLGAMRTRLFRFK